MGSNKAVGRQCLLCSRTSEVHSYHSCMVALMPVHLSPPMAIQLSWYISSSPMACCLSISKWRLPSLPVYHSHNYRYPLVAMVHSLVRSKSCDIIFLEMLSGWDCCYGFTFSASPTCSRLPNTLYLVEGNSCTYFEKARWTAQENDF